MRVLLLEAGGKDRSPNIKIPAAFAKQFHSKLDWDYETEPEPHVDGRQLYMPRGRTLGGCSSMNAMLYVRGRPLDYDGWEAQGAPGWGYADVLPYFVRSEDNVRGASRLPRRRRPAQRQRAALAATAEPALSAGERRGRDPDDRRLQRPRAGRRGGGPGHAAKRAALQHGRRLPAPGAQAPEPRGAHEGDVLGIELEGERAVGVRLARGRGEELVRAQREVLLSAGAINSPQLLLLSGIGPAQELAAAGVQAHHDLPGWGATCRITPSSR